MFDAVPVLERINAAHSFPTTNFYVQYRYTYNNVTVPSRQVTHSARTAIIDDGEDYSGGCGC